jgi:hypothetical protein
VRHATLTRAARLLAAAVLITGCGKSESEEATDVVREFVVAANERDADRLCGDLVTENFVRQTTLATGEDARDNCRDQVDLLRRPRIELLEIESVRVDGDRATVVTQLDIGGERRRELFQLAKEDGEFRLDNAPLG